MTELLDAPKDGFSSTKFRNKTRSGAVGPNLDRERIGLILISCISSCRNLFYICRSCFKRWNGGDNATAQDILTK
jgi:hypothetical protein